MVNPRPFTMNVIETIRAQAGSTKQEGTMHAGRRTMDGAWLAPLLGIALAVALGGGACTTDPGPSPADDDAGDDDDDDNDTGDDDSGDDDDDSGDDDDTGDDDAAPTPQRILCIGDSITEARFQHYAYRYYLWELMVADGIEHVDFVGSMSGTYAGGAPTGGWDSEHDGHWGAKADEILYGGLPHEGVGSIQDWAPAYLPTIALIQLGTNDCRGSQSPESTLGELAGIIDVLRQSDPTVLVLVAQVIQTRLADVNSCLGLLNTQMVPWAAGLSTVDSPVVVVDQWSALDPVTDLEDDFHTNESGGEKMAVRWYETLDDYLLGP
jgi:lysophospholipase L1-like esterase